MQDPAMFSAIGTWVAACVSLVAAILFYKNLVWLQSSQKSKEFADCAIAALESAYKALMDGCPDDTPQNCRGNWISCARQLEFFRRLKAQVSSSEYMTKCGQVEERYRHRFHSALCLIPCKVESYFASSADDTELGLEPRSLAVVFSFAFNEKFDDPLEKVSVQALLGSSTAIKYNRALKIYLVRLGELPKA